MPRAQKARRLATATRPKDPKASHLYTDDNPKTTLHGTGFKNAASAHRTIELVSQRSLTYQFQTINTMLYRAKGHPHKTATMQDAIAIFQSWVDKYAERKSALRVFKLLPRATVEQYLKLAEEYNEAHEEDTDTLIDLDFAHVYINLPSKGRLANTLVNQAEPGEEDWEIKRYRLLCDLVPLEEQEHSLWQEDGKPSVSHLRTIMLGYSPSKKVK